jgi:tetratricopeptide (TPR) repeat protein
LTRLPDRHLSSDELNALVSLRTADGGGPGGLLSEEDLGEALRHADSCEVCKGNLQSHESLQREILRIGFNRQSPQDSSECVGEVEWLEVAAGLMSDLKARELMKHAARCARCGPLLRNAAETLSDETTPSEDETLAHLTSARPEWQEDVAHTLRTNADRRRWAAAIVSLMRAATWPRFAYAFGGIVVIALVAWLGVRELRPPSVERLLADAYTQRRTLEVRISGAKYAPMKVERETGRSNLDKPPSLLKAEALISENLNENPNDPLWLQARARADLLDGNYESAIKSLQHALEVQPDSPSLLTDLGSAYFLRAESADRPIDYGNAIESFSKALSRSPNDPVTLFNRGLACERMFLYTQARDDWEHYLQVDPKGEWAEDVRQKLADLKQTLRQRERSQAEPLLTPREVTKAASDPMIREDVNQRVEEYMRVALIDWLPRAFPEPVEQASTESRDALSQLAEIAREKHSDTWLADLLNGPTGTTFSAGLNALATALQSNDRGDYVRDRESSRRAVQLFRTAGNRAAELRAQAEEVYSDHLLWEGSACLALVSTVNQSLDATSYTWLKAQMLLEKSNCANLVGDLGTYRTAIKEGMSQAQAHDYSALYLRALGFQALSDVSLGDSRSAFSSVSKGLSLFWSGKTDLMKGYNLYTDLDAAADGLRLPNLQVLVSQEATTLVDQQPDVLLQAMAHRWYAYAAYLANNNDLASLEFAKARDLFDAAPRSVSTMRHRLNAEMWLAQIEIRQGDFDKAAARLQTNKTLVDSIPSFGIEIDYYTAQADIYMRRDDTAAAESAIRSAVFLAEWALDSYPRNEDRREWAEQTRSAYRNAVEWQLRKGEILSALELWEWYRGASVRAKEFAPRGAREMRTMENPPDTDNAPALPSPDVVAGVAPLLHDETVIAFGTFPDGIAVWVYDDRGIFSQWIPTSLPLVQELALRLGRLCEDPLSDLVALQTTARSLYDLLLAPVETLLVPGRTIVLEPDDILEAVPWEVLVDSDSRYLAERNAVVVAPSLYQTIRLRPSAVIAREGPALIISVPAVPTEHLPMLADADDEAETVARMFISATRLQGAQATLAAARSGIRGTKVFHFAGHASASIQRSGLMLAEVDPVTTRARLIDAGSFSADEVQTLDLAVLSACNTEGEATFGNSGTESLTASLLQDGVPHVVATRWNVDSSETAKFMKQFYAHLLAGSGVADSMHSARLAMISEPALSHPYYWAAFELQGLK